MPSSFAKYVAELLTAKTTFADLLSYSLNKNTILLEVFFGYLQKMVFLIKIQGNNMPRNVPELLHVVEAPRAYNRPRRLGIEV